MRKWLALDIKEGDALNLQKFQGLALFLKSFFKRKFCNAKLNLLAKISFLNFLIFERNSESLESIILEKSENQGDS